MAGSLLEMRIHSFCKIRIVLYINLKDAQETSNILYACKRSNLL